MKKLSAIALLSLLLFNLGGYRLYFNYLQQEHRDYLEARLDQSAYNSSELIEIRVPLSMPYMANQNNYERIDGEISVEGRFYKYVKRKVIDGQLILLCLPDERQTSIDHAKNEFTSQANGTGVPSKKNQESVKKINIVSEFEESARQSLATIFMIYQHPLLHFISPLLSQGFIGFADKPPQHSSC